MAATIPTNVVTAMGTANAAAPTGAEGQQIPLSVDLAGNLRVTGASGSFSSVSTAVARSTVNDSALSVQLVAANASRKQMAIRNTSSAILHVCPGAATATANTAVTSLSQNGIWNAPEGYQGPVQGIWATDPNDGVAVISEYT